MVKKSEVVWKELREHLPSTFVLSLFAGVLVALIFLLDLGSSVFLGNAFEIAHPLHVLVSAAATAAIFRKYKNSFLSSLVMGIV